MLPAGMEGMIDALLDDANPHARRLLAQAALYIVPNMNPDGSVRGKLNKLTESIG